MADPHSERLKNAFALMKSGDKAQAYNIVEDILREDKLNLNAWWLMSYLVDDEDRLVKSLQQVLSIDPNHSKANERLAKLRHAKSETSQPSSKNASTATYDKDYWHRLSQPPKRRPGKWEGWVKDGIKARTEFAMVAGGILAVLLVIGVIVSSIGAVFNLVNAPTLEDVNGNTPKDVALAYERAKWFDDFDTMFALSCEDQHSEVSALQARATSIYEPLPSDFTIDISGLRLTYIDQEPPSHYTVAFTGEVSWHSSEGDGSYSYTDAIAEQGGDVWMGEHVTRIDGVWLVCTGPDTIYR